MPSPYLINDPRFKSLIRPDAELRRLYDQCEWAEGPVWLPDDAALVWSDIPNDRMLRWSGWWTATGASGSTHRTTWS